MRNVIGKKVGRLLLAAVLAVLFVPGLTQEVNAAGAEPPQVDGVYQISTADHMVWLADEVNEGRGSEYNAKLLNDIDLSDVAWTPISYKNSPSGVVYKGKFDGNQKTITLDQINTSVYEDMTFARVGLFGTLGSGGIITDLTISGKIQVNLPSKPTTSLIGSVVGYMEGNSTVVNCINDAEIARTDAPSSNNSTYTGGIAGENSMQNARIINCYNGKAFEDMVSRYVAGISGNGGYNRTSIYQSVNGARIGAKEDPYTGAAAAIDGADNSKPTECYNADVEMTYKDESKSPKITDAIKDELPAKIATWNTSVSEYTTVDDFWDISPEGYPIPRQINGYETIRNLTNVEVADKGANAPLEGDFVSKYAAARSYVLPDTVTVKVEGNELGTADYTWDKATGTLTIPEARITGGPVEITISADTHSGLHDLTETVGDNITYTASENNAVSDDKTQVYEGTDFVFDLASAEKYQIGDVNVTVGGTAVMPTVEKNSLGTKATVTIVSDDITGDLVIDVKAKKSPEYTVASGSMENAVYSQSNVTTAYEGWPLEVEISAEEGYYLLKKNISITAGSDKLGDDEFTFKDNKIEINAEAVTGNITINAKAIPPILQEVQLVDELEDGEQYIFASTSLNDQNGDLGYVMSYEASGTSKLKSRPATLVKNDGKLYIASPTMDQEFIDSIWEAQEEQSGFQLKNNSLYLYGSSTTLRTQNNPLSSNLWNYRKSTNAENAITLYTGTTTNYSLLIGTEEASRTYNYSGNDIRAYVIIDSSLADHTVNFVSNGGSDVAQQTVKEGKKVKKPKDPTKSGYSLEGWYSDEARTQKWDFKTDTVTEDITLYAKWAPLYNAMVRNVTTIEPGKTYIITNNSGNIAMMAAESASSTSTAHYMDGQNVKISSAEDMITFSSENDYKECVWNTESGAESGSFSFINEAKSVNLWGNSSYLAVSQVNSNYKKDFKMGNYGMYIGTSTTYGAQYNTSGKYFNLQFYASAGNRIKFYEILESYKITFDTGIDGTDPILQTVKSGEKATKPDDPTRSGYKFVEWQDQNGDAFDFETPITEDTKLKAGWEEIPQFTITFDSNGGSAVDPVNVEEGTPVSEPTAPTHEGYELKGWYTDTSLAEDSRYDFSKPVDSDLELIAGWKNVSDQNAAEEAKKSAEEAGEALIRAKDAAEEADKVAKEAMQTPGEEALEAAENAAQAAKDAKEAADQAKEAADKAVEAAQAAAESAIMPEDVEKTAKALEDAKAAAKQASKDQIKAIDDLIAAEDQVIQAAKDTLAKSNADKQAAEEAKAKAEAEKKAAEKARAEAEKKAATNPKGTSAGKSAAVKVGKTAIRTIGNAGKKQIRVERTKAAKNAKTYKLSYRKAGTKKWTDKWITASKYTVKGLKKKGLYQFKEAGYAPDKGVKGKDSKISYRYISSVTKFKAKAGKKKIKLRWKADKKATGYVIKYSISANMKNAKTIKISGGSKKAYTIKKLAKGKKYYVQIAPIKKSGGKTYTGILGAKKSIKAK